MANSSTMLIGFIFVIILSCITCLFSMVISSISGFGYNNYDCILGCVEDASDEDGSGDGSGDGT